MGESQLSSAAISALAGEEAMLFSTSSHADESMSMNHQESLSVPLRLQERLCVTQRLGRHRDINTLKQACVMTEAGQTGKGKQTEPTDS